MLNSTLIEFLKIYIFINIVKHNLRTGKLGLNIECLTKLNFLACDFSKLSPYCPQFKCFFLHFKHDKYVCKYFSKMFLSIY